MLPDEVLLGIFRFYPNQYRFPYEEFFIEAWQTLVHVCQRWRNVVFGSPRHLNLRLSCTSGTHRDKLNVWPPLPFLISNRRVPITAAGERRWSERAEIDNIVAILELADRVQQIDLLYSSSLHYLNNVLAAMQKPFPQLSNLTLMSPHEFATMQVKVPVIPDSFLGGSAPCLRELSLERVPFPGLPKLLLSATNLVGLHLYSIPHSGYISPEAMLATLSVLTNLRSLHLQFKSPQSRPNQTWRPSPLTRSVLPVLSSLKFKGVISYLEDLVAWIDAPQLSTLFISFFDQIEFYTPELIQFIRRTPTLKEFDTAGVSFEYGATRVNLLSLTSGYRTLSIGSICTESVGHLPSLKQVLTSSLSPISTLKGLCIFDNVFAPQGWQAYIQTVPLPELLHPFAAVKNLYLSELVAECIAFSLQELVGGGMPEVLPNLENIFLEEPESSGPVQEHIGRIVAALQATGHPISVNRWNKFMVDRYDGGDFEPDEYQNEDDDW